MINLFNLIIMTIKKKPVRVQFVNSHIEPFSVRFEIFRVDENASNRILKNCGLLVPIGSLVVLLYTGENNDYLIFSDVNQALDFCRLNGLLG